MGLPAKHLKPLYSNQIKIMDDTNLPAAISGQAPDGIQPANPNPGPQEPKIITSEELPSGYNANQLPDEHIHDAKEPESPRDDPQMNPRTEPAETAKVDSLPPSDSVTLSAVQTAHLNADAQETKSLKNDSSRSPQQRKFSDAIFHIEIEKIKPNPHQPRRDFDEELLKELAASMQEFGILQPLVVSKIERDTDHGQDVEYELIAGERRLRAAQMLGWARVPVIIRSTVHKSEQLEMAIVENLQRSNLNPIETARAYAKLQDEFGLTQREVSSRLSKSRESIANTLRLLSLPTEIQDAISKNQINESQGRLLLMIEDAKEQRHLFEELLHRSMSVRELRTRIYKGRAPKPAAAKKSPLDPAIKTFEEELQELLGARVKIEKEKSGEAGKIIISFYSPEEIEGIIRKLNYPQPSAE